MSRCTGRISHRAVSSLGAALASLVSLAGCAGGGDRLAVGNPIDADVTGARLADAMLRAGAPDAALRITEEQLRHDPRNGPAMLRRGEALLALDQPGEAAEVFAHAAGIPGGDGPETTLGLARARTRAGEAVEAEAAWRAALARAPSDAQARSRLQTGLAVSLDLQGRHDAAQSLYRAVLAASPDDVTARADLGLSLALSGRAAEALPPLRAALREGPNAGRLRQNLAVGLSLAGDERGATTLLLPDLGAEATTAAVAGLRQFAAVP